ncbi:hypothetical protein ACLMJK_008019 [Lecanora helva]
MPRQRPQLSITLPKNFTFHYTEGEEPKTPPEQEIPTPLPQSPPRAANAYRVKRRTRPSVAGLFQDSQASTSVDNKPLPNVEAPRIIEPVRPAIQQWVSESASQTAGPSAPRKYTTLPRTPLSQHPHFLNDWNSTNQDIGESISRPMSSCSLFSNSSEESNGNLSGSLLSLPTGDGSCTSPESDAADPFKFPPVKKSQTKEWAGLARNTDQIQSGLSTKETRVSWTPEMDRHLWSTYLIYLQDPTVTPFKTLPGTAPPLGVCHRVAREARRSWRMRGKAQSRKPSELLSPPISGDVAVDSKSCDRSGSPDTIRAGRSGSNTPTAADSKSSASQAWPKSGSSTRRRLRQLCRGKPVIAAHYQRLMKSRSPSPFSSPRQQGRGQSRLSEVSSPLTQSTSFNTRDVQLSLTTSTAATMQPDAPLARMTSEAQPNHAASNEWFNEPPVPWASTPAIPSDIDTDNQGQSSHVPSLGSPFGFHTWGPSRSRQRVRPSTQRMQSSDASATGPSLRSPVRLHDTFPYPGVQKRRARHQLEDELSPGGSSMQQELLDNLFGSPPEGRHRRVRSRGFSLGDVTAPNPLEHLFTPPTTATEQATSENTETSASESLEPSQTPTQSRRLGSPFHGISRRPTRTPSRHMAATSLDSHDVFSSIGETLGQSNNGSTQGPTYR